MFHYKCHKKVLPSSSIIQSFLSNRTFKIKISDVTSTLRTIKAGVPQGSCLSPLLYSHYINNLPAIPFVSTSQFADDTMFYSSNCIKENCNNLSTETNNNNNRLDLKMALKTKHPKNNFSTLRE